LVGNGVNEAQAEVVRRLPMFEDVGAGSGNRGHRTDVNLLVENRVRRVGWRHERAILENLPVTHDVHVARACATDRGAGMAGAAAIAVETRAAGSAGHGADAVGE